MIYDELFEPLTQQKSQHLETYVQPNEWQETSLSDLFVLEQTCKDPSNEVLDHFHNDYVARIALHTSDLRKLHSIVERI